MVQYRIVKITYASGNETYVCEEINFRGGYDRMYHDDGKEVKFPTFKEAFNFLKKKNKNALFMNEDTIIKEEVFDIF